MCESIAPANVLQGTQATLTARVYSTSAVDGTPVGRSPTARLVGSSTDVGQRKDVINATFDDTIYNYNSPSVVKKKSSASSSEAIVLKKAGAIWSRKS